MNFVVTHIHTPEQYPSGNPEMMKVLQEVCPSTEFAEKCGVKVLNEEFPIGAGRGRQINDIRPNLGRNGGYNSNQASS